MNNLTVVAILCKCRKTLAVPLRNIYKFSLAKSLNNRINRNQEHLMFWSSDYTKEPNFSLPISDQFDKSHDACFLVKLLKVFGKFMKNYSFIVQRNICDSFDMLLSKKKTEKMRESINGVVVNSTQQYTMKTVCAKNRFQSQKQNNTRKKNKAHRNRQRSQHRKDN